MERATTWFWLLVALLLGASAYYAGAVWRMRLADKPKDVQLASGDVVRLHHVVDGDTVVVVKLDGDTAAPATAGPAALAAPADAARVTVRLLGIKAFDSKAGKDEAALHGRSAEEALRRLAGEQPLRVLLNSPPKDRSGRTLASLYAGGEDLGLALVARGHVLVYTVYPFPNMAGYLSAQRQAREQRLGLWADPLAVELADALARQWARGAP